MNALTAVKQPDDVLSRTTTGFSIAPSVQSPRLLELTFCAEVTQQFLREVEQWPVQPLEYKSFLRFKIAKILDDMCDNQLQPLLLNTLLSRDEGTLQIGSVETYRRKRAGTHLAKRRRTARARGQYHLAGGDFCPLQRDCQLSRGGSGDGTTRPGVRRRGDLRRGVQRPEGARQQRGHPHPPGPGVRSGDADQLLRADGLPAGEHAGHRPLLYYLPVSRREYFRQSPEHNQIVIHLIYPIPDPAMPLLGVHLTRMIDGSVTVGPNAVLAFKREGYCKGDALLSTGEPTYPSWIYRHSLS